MPNLTLVAPAEDEVRLVVRPGKWTLTVVMLLRGETQRFNELRRQAKGISQKTLTTTLRELERDGFVSRTMYATIPPRVDYELTPLGREFLALADSWRGFAAQNRRQIESARRHYDQSDGETAVRLVHP